MKLATFAYGYFVNVSHNWDRNFLFSVCFKVIKLAKLNIKQVSWVLFLDMNLKQERGNLKLGISSVQWWPKVGRLTAQACLRQPYGVLLPSNLFILPVRFDVGQDYTKVVLWDSNSGFWGNPTLSCCDVNMKPWVWSRVESFPYMNMQSYYSQKLPVCCYTRKQYSPTHNWSRLQYATVRITLIPSSCHCAEIT